MLELEGLHAYYGRSHIVQGVTLRAGLGEGVGLVGHNGVGKTTTLRAIMGAGPRARGGIAFEGRSLASAPVHARARLGLGLVPEADAVFPAMTVQENIRAAAFLLPKARQRECLDLAYELFPILGERREQLAGTLSGGQQKMLALARGLALQPRLIMVDEPSEGLMPINVELIATALRRAVDEGVGVLVVDASFDLLKTVCSRLYVMRRGVITGEHRLQDLPTAERLVAAYLHEDGDGHA